MFVDRDRHPETPSGRASSFARLARHLGEHVEVAWVFGHSRPIRDLILAPKDFRVELGAHPSMRETLWWWRAVREAIASFHPDIAIVRGLEIAAWRLPTVSVVRDLVQTGWDPDPARGIGRWLAPWHQAIVVPTDSVRRELGAIGVSDWRITKIAEIVDLPPQPLPLVERPVPMVIVGPGSVHPSKGQHLIIDAVHRLPRVLRERVELHLVGPVRDPRYAAQLKASSTGIPVYFDPAEELSTLVRSADVVIYPTMVNEGFADAAVFAMAEGRPVIYSDLPALRETLGDAAIAIPPGDVAALRHGILSILDGLVDLRALGAKARDRVEGLFGWKTLWPKWRMLLTQMARQPL